MIFMLFVMFTFLSYVQKMFVDVDQQSENGSQYWVYIFLWLNGFVIFDSKNTMVSNFRGS